MVITTQTGLFSSTAKLPKQKRVFRTGGGFDSCIRGEKERCGPLAPPCRPALTPAGVSEAPVLASRNRNAYSCPAGDDILPPDACAEHPARRYRANYRNGIQATSRSSPRSNTSLLSTTS